LDKNYLFNRMQYVQYNGICSLFNTIKCGVPQGSILDPLLFLIYINAIYNATDIGEIILFADDTNLFYSHDNLSSLMSLINSELCTTSYPGSFHYAPRWRKDPGPGWSRVSQILGDNKIFT
jgi:hypothetical protein